MGSAMTSPAQIGQIRQRIPVTKQLGVTRNVQGILNVGLQKSRNVQAMFETVAKTGLKVAELKITADDANNTSAQKAASAERTNYAAAYATQLKIDANKLNPDGTRVFETAEQTFNDHMATYDKQLREKYKFSGEKAEAEWTISRAGDDKTYVNSIKVWANDAKIEQTKALDKATLTMTRDPEIAKEVYANGVKSGLYTEGEATIGLMKWQSEVIQTDLVVATDNLGRNAKNMNETDFENSANSISEQISNPVVPIKAEVQRRLLQDLSKLREDYEENIITQRQDLSYARTTTEYSDAVIAGNPQEIARIEEQIRSPEAQENFGDNYIKLTTMMNTRGEAKVSSGDAVRLMGIVVEEIRDGIVTPKYGQSILEGYSKELSNDDYVAIQKAVNTAADPKLSKSRSEAKYWSGRIIVGTANLEGLSAEQQRQKAGLIASAAKVEAEIIEELEDWYKGDSPRPMPNPRKMVIEKWAQNFTVDRYTMVNSSGNVPKDLWDIDVAATQAAIDTKYDTDMAIDPSAEILYRGTRSEQNRLLEQVRNLLQAVPQRPEQ